MEGDIPGRATGVLVSIAAGRAVAYGLDTLQQRAELHVGPGDVVYEGMIVGENSRSGDMNVNPDQGKEALQHAGRRPRPQHPPRPARRMSLEEALEFIADDELVEVTPTQIRLRKILLKEVDRRRADRKAGAKGLAIGTIAPPPLGAGGFVHRLRVRDAPPPRDFQPSRSAFSRRRPGPLAPLGPPLRGGVGLLFQHGDGDAADLRQRFQGLLDVDRMPRSLELLQGDAEAAKLRRLRLHRGLRQFRLPGDLGNTRRFFPRCDELLNGWTCHCFAISVRRVCAKPNELYTQYSEDAMGNDKNQ